MLAPASLLQLHQYSIMIFNSPRLHDLSRRRSMPIVLETVWIFFSCFGKFNCSRCFGVLGSLVSVLDTLNVPDISNVLNEFDIPDSRSPLGGLDVSTGRSLRWHTPGLKPFSLLPADITACHGREGIWF